MCVCVCGGTLQVLVWTRSHKNDRTFAMDLLFNFDDNTSLRMHYSTSSYVRHSGIEQCVRALVREFFFTFVALI
jgi:hypothetical protein